MCISSLVIIRALFPRAPLDRAARLLERERRRFSQLPTDHRPQTFSRVATRRASALAPRADVGRTERTSDDDARDVPRVPRRRRRHRAFIVNPIGIASRDDVEFPTSAVR